MRLIERFRWAPAAVFLATVAGSLASVLLLPDGHPIRIVAAVVLFVVAPGLAMELALLRPRQPSVAWERIAVIGALGIAGSAGASVILFAVGGQITATSVGVATASLAIGAWLISLLGPRSSVTRAQAVKTLKFALALVVMVSGAVMGSATGSTERTEHFTILALEDVIAARAAIESGRVSNVPSIIHVIVESHEAETNEYQVLVVGGARSRLFALRPSERRIVDLDVAGAPEGAIEIWLLKSGRVDRIVRLSAS